MVEERRKTAGKKIPGVPTGRKRPASRGAASGLTVDQKKSLKALLAEGSSASVAAAASLLSEAKAKPEDWSDAFNAKTIGQLVNSWDGDVWSAIATALQKHPAVWIAFSELAFKRFKSLSQSKRIACLTTALRNLQEPASKLVAKLVRDSGVVDPHTSMSLTIGDLTTLTDSAAACLATCPHGLNLPGLTSLSDKAASHLAQNRGSILHLDGLTSLSADAAKSLATYKGRGDLSLDGLKSLPDAIADNLAKHAGWRLTLNGVTELTASAAERLARYKGAVLHLGRLSTISNAAARSLAKYKGELRLGVKALSDEAASSLGSHQGPRIWLDKLTTHSLSLAAIENLIAGEANVTLGNFESLSDAVAEVIGRKEKGGLSLKGLKTLSDDACRHLGKAIARGCLSVDSEIADRIHALEGRVLTKEPLVKMVKEDTKRGAGPLNHGYPSFDKYTGITDEAAQYLASLQLQSCSMSRLSDASDAALKQLSSIPDIQLPSLMRARLLKSKVSIADLQKHGFFKYVPEGFPPIQDLSYGGEGSLWPYQVTNGKGECLWVGRTFSADEEELVETGASYFFGDDSLRKFGVRASMVREISKGEAKEWRHADNRYPITGEGIGDSSYSRAAFAVVAILNQMLEEKGSDERAFGIGEGNEFGVVILTEPLRKIISKVADKHSKPIPQQQLEKQARTCISEGEPPLVR